MTVKADIDATSSSLLKYAYHFNKKGLIEMSNIVLGVIFSLQNVREKYKKPDIKFHISMKDWLLVTNLYIIGDFFTESNLKEILSIGNCNMTPLTITYSTPIPQWIKDKNYGDLWDAMPNQIVKDWFDDNYAIQYLCGQVKLNFDNVLSCYWNDKPDDFLVSNEVAEINTIVVEIKYGSDITPIQAFINGFKESGLYCSPSNGIIGKVVNINYEGDLMKSYELESGVTQNVGLDKFGYFYDNP